MLLESDRLCVPVTGEERQALRARAQFERRRRRNRRFLQVRPEPDLPELDALLLRQWMPDEAPPDRRPDFHLFRIYTPDGEPREASRLEGWLPLVMQAHTDQRRLAIRGMSFYRNRHRLDVLTDYVLGLDQGSGPGPALLFETQVWSHASGPLHQWRYATVAAARRGHQLVTHALWKAGRR